MTDAMKCGFPNFAAEASRHRARRRPGLRSKKQGRLGVFFVRGGGREHHFGGPVGTTPLMPCGGRVAQGAVPNYCNRQSIRYEFFEAWADLSIRCWIGHR